MGGLTPLSGRAPGVSGAGATQSEGFSVGPHTASAGVRAGAIAGIIFVSGLINPVSHPVAYQSESTHAPMHAAAVDVCVWLAQSRLPRSIFDFGNIAAVLEHSMLCFVEMLASAIAHADLLLVAGQGLLAAIALITSLVVFIMKKVPPLESVDVFHGVQ